MAKVSFVKKVHQVTFIENIEKFEHDLCTVLDVAVHGDIDGKTIVSTMPLEVRKKIAAEIMKYLKAYEITPTLMKFEKGVSVGQAVKELNAVKRLVA